MCPALVRACGDHFKQACTVGQLFDLQGPSDWYRRLVGMAAGVRHAAANVKAAFWVLPGVLSDTDTLCMT